MCTGAEIAYGVAAATAVVGTAVSYSAAQDQKDAAQDMAKRQEAQAAQDAAYAASEAELQARAIRKATDRQRAEARAALANSGAVVGAGTAEQIDTQIAMDGEQDALMAIYDGGTRASRIRTVGGMESLRSRNAARAAGYESTSALVRGASSLASGWKVNSGKGA
ncbi:hypothetical protein [uncultured Pseudacidovorax sp.]|uniref:hypothetical protein n=1 Tax=uncultured Pseudacidovorax sp. TaxID=679313 RepID=UPI0025F61AC0|nr:hypothetical protein [uncultured Pseudacidovorax sp.]